MFLKTFKEKQSFEHSNRKGWVFSPLDLKFIVFAECFGKLLDIWKDLVTFNVRRSQ